MVVKSETYETLSCKKTYVRPSMEVITEEEEPWIVCGSVEVEVEEVTGAEGNEGENEEISKYIPYSSTMLFDDDFENEDY